MTEISIPASAIEAAASVIRRWTVPDDVSTYAETAESALRAAFEDLGMERESGAQISGMEEDAVSYRFVSRFMPVEDSARD